MENSVKLSYEEVLQLLQGVSYSVDGKVDKLTEKVRNYTTEVIDGKVHINTYNNPVQVKLDGEWVNIEDAVSEEGKDVLYDTFQEPYLTSEIILDTDDPTPLSVRSMDKVRNLKDNFKDNGIELPREFTWVDGASETSGVIVLPFSDYSDVYIATDPDENGVPSILFIDEKTSEDQERPFYEKKDGKTYIYVDHFSGGGGTQSDPYIVSTEDDLNELVRSNTSAYFIQDRDITMTKFQTGEGWAPIENFTGKYDGRGYEIRDLYTNRVQNYVGLFGYLGSSNAEIKRVKLVNVNINAEGRYVGSLAGRSSANVYDCVTVSGTVVNEGTESTAETGGFIGRIQNSTHRCYSHADVSAKQEFVGGFVGYTTSTDIQQCFSTGKVTDATVAKTVSSIGGFSGGGTTNYSGATNFYDMDTSGFASSGAEEKGKTSPEMKEMATFESEGWDFTNYWHIEDYTVNQGYPENRKFIKYSKGKGIEGDPFLIYNQFDLEQVRHFLYAHFRLETDLVLDYQHTGPGWLPIGREGEGIGWDDEAFSGVFDGNGYSIGDMYINRTDNYSGMFRYVVNSVIKNLELVDVDMTLGKYGGALAGWVANSTIENVTVREFNDSNLSFTSGYAGVIVGQVRSGVDFINCHVDIPLTSSGTCIGGIVGYLYGQANSFIRCSTRGEWIGYNGRLGGIVGSNRDFNYSTGRDTVFEDCLSAADMTNVSTGSGGVFGYYRGRGSTRFILSRVIITAKVTGHAFYHSSNYDASAHVQDDDCFFDVQRVGEGSSGGMVNFTSLYTEEIRHPSIYEGSTLDFENVWFFDEDYDGDPNLVESKLPDPPILGFRNKVGNYYTDEQGNILRYLEYGTLVAGSVSDPYPVWLQNNADFPVVGMRTWVDNDTVKEGITVELSLSNNPFVPENELVFGGTVPIGDAKKFFVRFSSEVTVKEGGTFDLRAKASPS